MIRALTAVALLTTVSFAYAGQKECSALSEFAEMAAKAHYKDVPMRETMEVAGEEPFLEIVKRAYDLPDLPAGEYQRSQITQFGNDIYAVCLEAQ